MRVHALILICAAASIAACEASPPQGGNTVAGTSRADRRQAIEQIARSASHAAQDRSLTVSCNASHVAPELSQALIVTARQCYSCDAVGYAIRRIAKESSTELWILTTEADAGDVCRYLREERIRAPVALLPTTLSPTEVSNELTYFKLSTEGGINIVEGTSGTTLLRSLALNNSKQQRMP